jgi:putative DNA primase/helicase
MKNRPIHDRYSGQWPKIIPWLAPKMSDAVRKRPKHVPCPVHGGKDGLRCFDDFEKTGGMVCNTCGSFPNGYMVLSWARSISTAEAARLVRKFAADGGSSTSNNIIHLPSAKTDPVIDESALYTIRETLAQCLHPTVFEAEPARKYLLNRGVICEDSSGRALRVENLLYHPYLLYSSRCPAAHPALVASIVRDGEVVGLHKTYITQTGEKARGADSKRIGPVIYKGATTGGAIPLLPAAEEMAVAEGIESALAVYEESGMPVWAATSAGGLAAMEIPEFVRTVVVFADNDMSGVGQEAAERLARRMRGLGKKVRVYIPDRPKGIGIKSFDILDHLVEGRRDGFH